AFQGKIALSGVPALWVNSDYPSYWLSHTYDSYIAQGWVSSANHKLDVEPDGTLVSPQPYKGQVTVPQSVKVGFSSDAAFLGGDLVHVDRKVQVKTLTEPTQTTNTKSTEGPIALDIVAARFSKRLNPNDAYNLDSSVSIATDSELRRTGTDYPEWIKTYYLQLPGSLPDRVKVLAREVTRKADNPLDKALAVQGYLRAVEYSQEIDAPPFNADGVDHFLFETRKGYSDYFASAMAVMLRSVGVPVRVAAGYWYGTYDIKEKVYIIKDTDSHAWPQVYFPHYGWIDFEPSPNRPLPQRDFLPGGLLETSEFFDPFVEELESLENFEGIKEEPVPDGGSPVERGILTPWFSSLAAAVFLLLLSLIAWWYSWHHRLASVEVAERSYTKMSRLASLSRLQRRAQETPMEYANKLGQAIPPIQEEAKSIARAFEQVQYGRRNLTDEESGRAELAWRKVRGWLLMRAITTRLRGK
ncbi:MAG: transglutaminase domain-containing protein, partial [Chloroflexi bacterium]|nr:transglutaminase domain-containing protein [Chloroflexota bacterium]